MVSVFKKFFFSENMVQLQINFLFVSFVFLSGLKYDFFQFRFLILILLVPCGFNIIKECINKNFKNLTLFFFFLLILFLHSLLNIYFENTNFTKYNLFGIFYLTFIFVISFYYYENFNKNIIAIIKIFFLLFFTSIILSFLNFKNDAPFFCGGIPDIFGIFQTFEQYTPQGAVKSLTYLDLDRIGEMKLSFKEYLFPENSHLGMIAPSIMIYLLHVSFTKNTSKLFKFMTCLFIFICLTKSSTTLLMGTISSIILLISFNFKDIPKNTLISFSLILILFSLVLILSKECRSRFVPIYGTQQSNDNNSKDKTEIEPVGEINLKFASKLRDIMGTGGSLSSGIYFHSLMIAKKSIIKKPLGWGVNRYDKAFEYFNKKNPSKIEILNTYNNKDGSNNFVKLIVELGVFTIIIYLFLFLFLVNKKVPLEYKLFYLPFVVTQSLRGAGYFNSGFSLIIFLMLFTYLNTNKKYI